MKFRVVDTSMSAIGFVTGLSVGAVIGILLAPVKGSEARVLLSNEQQGTSELHQENESVAEDPEASNKEKADRLAYLGHKAEQGP